MRRTAISCCLLLLAPGILWAQAKEDQEARFKALEERIRALEAEIQALKSGPAPAPAAPAVAPVAAVQDRKSVV